MKKHDDPLAELHDVRRKILLEAGGTIDALFAWLKKRETQRKGHRLVPASPPKARRKGRVA